MATRNENPAPFMAVHPGMMVKPELVERGITQKEFAKMLGIQASHLSEVLNGKRALSTDLAVKIEEAQWEACSFHGFGSENRRSHRIACKTTVVCSSTV